MPDQVRVFVSHHRSPQEDAFTAYLVSDLQVAGADVWVDFERIPSGDFVRRINEGLAERDWLVLIMTPDALKSRMVQAEVDAALHQYWAGRMLGVVPFVAQACDERDIPPLWASLHRYDATKDYQSALAGLLGAIGLSASSAPPPAPVQKSPRSGILSWLRQSGHSAPLTPPPSAQMRQSPGPASRPEEAASPPALIPSSLSNLGFRARTAGNIQYILPPLCPVPGGYFAMGSDKTRDKTANKNEMPQHPVLVGDFSLAMYPVTVAEYDCAVRVKAVHEPLNEGDTEWSEQLPYPDHPVIGVAWQDALDYALWLAKLTGQAWRLPTEAEWEKAARGTDGRIYPWGDKFDRDKGNIGDDYGYDYSTTPVGTYSMSGGGSPYGVQDMIGNVWEWTSSQYKPYPYDANDGRENPYPICERVLRGGSWEETARFARAAYRKHEHADPTYRFLYDSFGFRLAWSEAGS